MCYVLKNSRGQYTKKNHDNVFVPVSSEVLADTFDTYQEAENAKKMLCKAKRKDYKVYSIDDKKGTEVAVDLNSIYNAMVGNTIDWQYIVSSEEMLLNKQKEIDNLKQQIATLKTEKAQAIVDKNAYHDMLTKQFNKYEQACIDLYHIPEKYNLNAVQYCRWGKLVKHFRKDRRRVIKNELKRLESIKEDGVDIKELKTTMQHQENPYYRFRYFENNGEDLIQAIKTGKGLEEHLQM